MYFQDSYSQEKRFCHEVPGSRIWNRSGMYVRNEFFIGFDLFLENAIIADLNAA